MQHRPATLVVNRPHWSWLVHISQSTSVVDHTHRLRLVHISRSFSSVVFSYKSGEFVHGLSASIRWFHLWPARIGQVTSYMAYEHRPSEISQRHVTTAKTYTYQYWCVCIDSTTRSWPTCICQVTLAFDRMHQPKISRI